MKINRKIYFRMDLCVHTPADEWKCNCACYAEKEKNKLNRYTDEQVHLRTVETLTGRSQQLIG